MTTYTETFNKADSPVLGPDLPWTKFSINDGNPVGSGPDDGEVSSNAYGVSGGDRTGLDPDPTYAVAYARAERNVGSLSMYAQAEIAALVDTNSENFPTFLLGASLTTFAGPLTDAYSGPTGVWVSFDPLGWDPDGCGIYCWLYDADTDTYHFPNADYMPGGGSPSYVQGPVLNVGDTLRITHSPATRRISAYVNDVLVFGASYAEIDNPIATFGQRGGLGIGAYNQPVPYPANSDRLDNFEMGRAPEVPANRLSARHYPRANFPDGESTPLELLEASFSDPLTELGAVTVRLRDDDDAAGDIDPDDYIVVSIAGSNGVPVDAVVMIVDDDDDLRIDPKEEQSQTNTFTGPTLVGQLKDGGIEPPNGFDVMPPIDDVHYDWTHPAYDDSDWDTANDITSVWYAQRDGSGNLVGLDPDHAGGRWAYLQWWTETMPPGNETAPDVRESTRIIGPNDGTIAGNTTTGGDIYLRDTFTPWYTGEHLYFLSGDNQVVLHLDGAEIAQAGFSGDTRTSGYEQPVSQGKVTLTAGHEYTVAIKLTNLPAPFIGVPNPAGVAASIYVPSYPVMPDDLVWETTDAMKMLERPAETPGMTPCEVGRVWLDEQQAAGRFTDWDLSCTADDDSANDAWTVSPIVSVRVGQDDGLSLFLKMMEAYTDVRIVAPTQMIDMYNKDAYAPASGVTFQPAVNLTSLRFHRQRMAADELMVRSQFGWTRVGGPGGRRQGAMTFGPENAFDEVVRLALAELAFSDDVREEVSFSYKPLSDNELPYVNENFVPGSTAPVPTKAGGTATERCVQIEVSWSAQGGGDEGEVLVVKVRFKSLVLQAEERILRSLKALGA